MTVDWNEHPEARDEFLDAHERYLAIEDGRLGDEFSDAQQSPSRSQQHTDPVESIEVERKYEVDADAVVPSSFAAVGLQARDPERTTLTATYFDTSGGDLARERVAVRRREGGRDAGWHMKTLGSEGARELHWPLAPEMPAGLSEEIARITDAPVVPLAVLYTHRSTLRLVDHNGIERVEIADDLVHAEQCATKVKRVWREWEAELLVGADVAVLNAIEPVLVQAGAARSQSPAKIVRAVGFIPEFDAQDRARARKLDE